jgi:hypothetical protein
MVPDGLLVVSNVSVVRVLNYVPELKLDWIGRFLPISKTFLDQKCSRIPSRIESKKEFHKLLDIKFFCTKFKLFY